ncbi:MAG: preprotein translocase subunit SecG [Candidatus Fimadaptatus sp.]|jgi:preprotein translocase subunit SecG
MDVLYIIANVFLLIAAVILVVVVLMQDGNSQGLGAVSGGAETFFGKSKARSIDGKLKLITKVAAVVFIVLAVVMTALSSHLS